MARRVIKSTATKAKALTTFVYRSLDENGNGGLENSDLPEAVRSLFSLQPEAEAPVAEPEESASQPPPEPAPPPPEPEPPPAPEERIDPHEIQKRAFEEGFAHGEKAGREMGERQMEVILKRLAESLNDVGRLRNNLYRAVEREVLQLALTIAKKLVHREVTVDPDIALTLVRVAMSHISEKTTIKVRLNPVDHDALIARRADLNLEGGESGVVLQADSSIDRGGCHIETEYGNIDARIEEQFKEVERGLLEIAPG